MPTTTVLAYDTTLRDGSQGEGVSFSLEDKLRLTRALDDLGIRYIEGGWPGSNPKDIDYFEAMRGQTLRQASLVAFGSTRRAANRADADPGLRQLVDSGATAICIVGKAWDLHVRDALRVGLDDNLDMIASSIAWLKKRTGEVFFDAEHFFDGYRANPDYTLQVLATAHEAGADFLVLCDTNGGGLPGEIAAGVGAVKARLPRARLAIHCHNDSGLATANSLEAVLHGAEMVQGSLNGFGERTGNADLCVIIPLLELKCGRDCIGPENLKKLTGVSRFAYELASLPRRDFQPFVGASAFAHKGGLHVSAMARNKQSYEAFSPESVGNLRRILISELSGRSTILARHPELRDSPEKQQLILNEVMRLEKDGYAFENAEASFELLAMKLLGIYEPAFDLLGFRASSEERIGSVCLSEASVKLRIGNEVFHTVSEGEHGPVSALDLALRKALVEVYPFCRELRLIDYRVHIVNARAAADAKVRVVVQSQEGDNSWGTVGVSENILHASSQALVDSFQFLVHLRGGKAAARPGKRISNRMRLDG